MGRIHEHQCARRSEWRVTSAMADQAIDAMDRAAENVRAANHATLHRGDFDHHDLYRLMGEVSTVLQRLPQRPLL